MDGSQQHHQRHSTMGNSGVLSVLTGPWKERDVEITLKKGLKARQLTMVTLGITLGTGLIVGSGGAIHQGGPLGTLMAYGALGFIAFSVLGSLGEMTTYVSHHRGLGGYVSTFWNPAVGFAVGWNYLLQFWMLSPVQINAAGKALYEINSSIPIAAWMAMVIGIIIIINLLPVNWFGEFEFWHSTLKVTFLIGLLIFGIVYNAGGAPLAGGRHEYIGFRYWVPPNGPFGDISTGNPHLSRFLAICIIPVNALFAYTGIEIIGIAAGEARNPKKEIPSAVRYVFWSIFTLYMVGVFIVGLIYPSHIGSADYQDFLAESDDGNVRGTGGPVSPFIFAVTRMGNEALAIVFQIVVFTFALSAATLNVYVSSRTLLGLAIERKAPAIFKYVTPWRIPLASMAVSVAWLFLVFMNVELGVSTVFDAFVRLSTSAAGLTWICISVAHLRFISALKTQNKGEGRWQAPLQPIGAHITIWVVSILMIVKGFDTLSPFQGGKFVYSYIGIFIFGVSYLFWRWKEPKRSSTIPLQSVDLSETDDNNDDEEIELQP